MIGRLRRLRSTRLAELPPLVVGLAAVIFAAAVEGGADSDPLFWLGAAGALLSAACVLLPTQRWGPWAEAAPQAGAILSYSLIVAATGGVSSEFAALPLLPLLWFGLEGNSGQLAVGLTAFAVGLALPWLIAAPAEEIAAWYRTAILAGVGLGITFGPRVVAEAQRRRSARYKALAEHDGLTGLLNRRGWTELAEMELARSRRHGGELAVISLDLDGFKELNDSGGHELGDRMLVDAGAAFTEVLRPGDLLARAGGDEFLALLPECSSAGASRVADRVRLATPKPISSSDGVAPWDGEESLESLVQRADAALYAAKAGGRRRAVTASEETEVGARRRAATGSAVARMGEFDASAEGLLEDAGVMACTADSGVLLSVNRAFEKVLGRTPETLLARTFTDLVHPDDVEATVAVAADVANDGAMLDGFECRFHCADGSFRRLRWYARANGQIWRALAFDVTGAPEAARPLESPMNQHKEVLRR